MCGLFQRDDFQLGNWGTLITTRFKALDGEILKDKILNRIQSWSTKLVPTMDGSTNSVNSLQYFCALVAIFIIPGKVLKEVEGALMAFLWSSAGSNHNCAKVRWEQVRCPKEEGDLGFIRLE